MTGRFLRPRHFKARVKVNLQGRRKRPRKDETENEKSNWSYMEIIRIKFLVSPKTTNIFILRMAF